MADALPIRQSVEIRNALGSREVNAPAYLEEHLAGDSPYRQSAKIRNTA